MKKLLSGLALVTLLFCANVLRAQNTTVSGKVTAEDGSALPGVNVVEKGTSNGTVSDAEGKFSISAPAQATLVFTFIGYSALEVPVNGRSTIDVQLQPDIKLLDQVVVIGYGQQKKGNLTSSQSSINAEEITRLPLVSADQALQGRSPGVVVTQNDGAPGGAVSVRIRGVGSTGNNEPLYVIDGFPLINDNGSSAYVRDAQQAPNALASINPNDIESIEILKDASAAAIYGARAANGVVIITTKRGKKGDAKISFDSYYGVQQVSKTLPMANAAQFRELALEALQNGGTAPNPEWENPTNPSIDTDWQDAIFRTAPIQNYNLGVSGGGERLQSAVSLNYFRQDGTIIDTDFERVSARANIDFQASKRIKIGLSLTPSRTFSNDANTAETSNGVLMNAFRFHPTIPLYDETGYGEYPVNALYYPNSNRNPVGQLDYQKRNTERMRLLGTVFAEVEIISGLKFKANFGGDLNFGKGLFYERDYRKGHFNLTRLLQENRTRQTSFLSEYTLSYDKLLSEKHSISAVVGTTAQQFSNDNITVQGGGFLNNDIINIGSALSGRDAGGAFDTQKLLSYLGRVSYGYLDRYLVSASIRRDGSSRFGPNNRWGVFPSVSAGWRISSEEFMKTIPAISDLKLRASWGTVGNQEISPYTYLTNIRSNADISASFGTGSQSPAPGAVASNISNPDIKWEGNTTTNFGVDLGLFEDAVTLTADYFIRRSDDLLLNSSIPITTGFESRWVNAGEIENRGLELALTYRKAINDFDFSVTGNFGTLTNEVITLGVGEKPITSGGGVGTLLGVPGSVTITQKGSPIGSFYGHVVEGIFQTQSEIDGLYSDEFDRPYQVGAVPGDFKFKDVDGDGIITDEDRTILGNPTPKYNYGLNVTANYKGFDLTIFLQGVAEVDIFNANKLELYSMNNRLSSGIVNAHRDVYEGRWRGEGTSNTIPRVSDNDLNSNFRMSSFAIEDGSFLRARNIQLGYRIPGGIASRAGLSNARIYVAAQNLFTITKYSGMDPEIGSFRQNALLSNVDLAKYPVARTFLVGVNLEF